MPWMPKKAASASVVPARMKGTAIAPPDLSPQGRLGLIAGIMITQIDQPISAAQTRAGRANLIASQKAKSVPAMIRFATATFGPDCTGPTCASGE